jgi:ATP:ADP antiporter, AAA family
MSIPENEFGKLRAFFWPLYRHEFKKVIPMMIMLFLICFNYSILRNVKDAVVVTAKSSGAEVLPFIKVWVLLPMAILLTYAFTKLSNRFSQEKVFYIVISAFLVFFGLFTYVFYPMRDVLHPNQFADYLETVLPAGFKGMIMMIRNWTFTLFYVISELWGSIVLTVLFWGFANEITKINEARRFYGTLSVVASSAAIIAGSFGNFLTNDQSWDQTLNILVGSVIISGCFAMLTYCWMNKNVLQGPEYATFHQTNIDRQVKSKKKLSIRESFAYLSNSKYLLCLAVLVVSYNLVINMVEIVWKDQLRQLYPSPLDYNRYMNTMTIAVGLIATTSSLFMSQLIARFGWTRTALITPVAMLITSAGFFTFMLLRHNTDIVLMLTGTTPLAIAVFFGAAQVCTSKGCKYSAFDATTNMAYIPLDHEIKLKGKAAIDGVGSRLGKSGGSFIHQGLLMIFATVSSSAPYVAVILMVVISLWIIAARSLGRQFGSLVGEKGREDIGEAEAVAT